MSKRGFVRGARTPAPPVPSARVIVAPPLITTPAEVDEIIARLDAALAAFAADCGLPASAG